MYDTVWLTRISSAFALLANSHLYFLSHLLNFIAYSVALLQSHFVLDNTIICIQTHTNSPTHRYSRYGTSQIHSSTSPNLPKLQGITPFPDSRPSTLYSDPTSPKYISFTLALLVSLALIVYARTDSPREDFQ